jgi:putative ABC transport system permease protein
MLALAGGAAGIVLAQYGVDLLLYLGPEELPRQDDIVLDIGVTVFAFALSLVSGILFGLVPALHAAKADVNSALKESGRSVAGTTGGNRIRLALVVAQVALSLVLLIGAGLMIRSFANMRRVDLGFDPSNLLTFKLEISPRTYSGDEAKWRFYQQALETIRGYPGVESASGTGSLPLDRWEMMDVFALPANPDDLKPGLYSPIMPGYFATMGIPLAGRDFTEKDNDDGAAVAIVDEQFANRTWPGENAIGKRIFLRAQMRTPQLAEIVGVAKHVQYGGLDEDPRPQIYMPYRNFPIVPSMTVRASVDPMSIAAPLKKVVEGLGHRRPAWDVRTMDSLVADAMAETRFALVLLGVLSVVAFVLSVVGVYGVVAYSVAERMTEFAIRMALGAQPHDILKIALGWGVIPALTGTAIGLAGAFALTRFLSSLLFGVGATDLTTYVSLSLLLLPSALFAWYVPVRLRVLNADTKTFL